MTTRMQWRAGLRAVACICALVAAPLPALAQALPDVQSLGPRVGERVPDFSLKDQQGQARPLASLAGPNGLMLVFFRSADWCPYCKTQLAELQQRSADLRKEGLGLAAISYDPVSVLADFARRRGISFPLLSDPGSATIRRYGILNTTIPESNTQSYGIPFPGTFMLDARGVVTARFFEPAYQERATVGSILATLGKRQGVRAVRAASAQLEVTGYVTDDLVAPGSRFSVVLDVKPGRGMHVYAPGVTGYRPVAFTLAPQAGLLIQPPQYPPAEDYHFKPLDEHVRVFQHPFRIQQPLAIDASPAAQAALKDQSSLTLRGTLQYQACDDRVCYSPQTVALEWTVAVRALDRERATKP